MRPGLNSKRPRTHRGNARRGGSGQGGRSHTYDSNGPDVKIRGNPNQIYDKYVSLARDATSSGDRVTAENYLQHAEHYYRLVNGNGSGQRQQQGQPQRQGQPQQQEQQQGQPQEQEQPQGQPEVAEADEAQPAAEAPGDPANEPQPTLD